MQESATNTPSRTRMQESCRFSLVLSVTSPLIRSRGGVEEGVNTRGIADSICVTPFFTPEKQGQWPYPSRCGSER